MALKYFAMDPRYIVIASGSLLGISLSKVKSFPVGYADQLEMKPMDFEEFLWAKNCNNSQIKAIIDLGKKRLPEISSAHEELTRLVREYVILGGMPEQVSKSKDLPIYLPESQSKIRNIGQNMLKAYRDDIAKFADSPDRTKAQACFDSIPAQLAKDNKKFMYRYVSRGGRASQYESSIDWLENAGLINRCYCIADLACPLNGFKDYSSFKVYMSDTGLLLALLSSGAIQMIYIFRADGHIQGCHIRKSRSTDVSRARLPSLLLSERPKRRIGFRYRR